MFRRERKYRGGEKKKGKAVTIYVNLGNTGYLSGQAPQAADPFTLTLYVDYRHGIARSFYLIPLGARVIHLLIEDDIGNPKVVEFLDSNLQTLHNAETTDSGLLQVQVSEFLNGCCYLRFENGRLLCMSIDKWPNLQPPFMRPLSR